MNAMLAADEKNKLLDEFSQQVRRHFPEAVWRSLFQERTGRAEFGSAERTLVCVEVPAEGALTREGLLASVRRLVERHDGVVDPCAGDFVFASFADAQAALQMTVALQRLLPRARLRTGMGAGRCRMVLCNAEGHDFLLLLGKERARVEDLTRRAAPATVQLTPEAYERLQAVISHELGSVLVMAEFDEDVLREVSLTLPPDPSADVSTFAGLGLTRDPATW
jgi:hypothetical protein